MIIGYKFGIYQLPQEFLNDLNHSLVSSLLGKMKILLILAKTLEKQKLSFSCSALFHMKTKVSLKYFVNGCSSSFNLFGPRIKRVTSTPEDMVLLTVNSTF